MSGFVGIDPGLGGAIALIDGAHVEVIDAPTIEVTIGRSKRRGIDHRGALDILREWSADMVAIEAITPNPKFGAIQNHVLGRSVATWETCVVALNFPYRLVRPVEWKRGVGLPTGAVKGDSIMLARRLFPKASLARVKDDGRAEALLIAYWLSGSADGIAAVSRAAQTAVGS